MLWTLLTLIIPSISAYLGAILRPIPPPYQVEKQVRLIQQEAYSKTLEKISSYEKRQNAIPSTERSERLRAYQNQVIWEEIQSVYRDVSSIRNSYTSKLYQQIQLSQTISCLSPFSSFVYLTSDLCHTGIFSNWHFRRSVEKYQGEFIDYVHERLMKLDSLNEPPNLDTLPNFSYREKEIGEIIQIHWLHLTLLILYATLFFLAAHISFLRYDVR
jgi:ABC-type transport system involved in multi-copper enzyme maturation permease subunit